MARSLAVGRSERPGRSAAWRLRSGSSLHRARADELLSV